MSGCQTSSWSQSASRGARRAPCRAPARSCGRSRGARRRARPRTAGRRRRSPRISLELSPGAEWSSEITQTQSHVGLRAEGVDLALEQHRVRLEAGHADRHRAVAGRRGRSPVEVGGFSTAISARRRRRAGAVGEPDLDPQRRGRPGAGVTAIVSQNPLRKARRSGSRTDPGIAVRGARRRGVEAGVQGGEQVRARHPGGPHGGAVRARHQLQGLDRSARVKAGAVAEDRGRSARPQRIRHREAEADVQCIADRVGLRVDGDHGADLGNIPVSCAPVCQRSPPSDAVQERGLSELGAQAVGARSASAARGDALRLPRAAQAGALRPGGFLDHLRGQAGGWARGHAPSHRRRASLARRWHGLAAPGADHGRADSPRRSPKVRRGRRPRRDRGRHDRGRLLARRRLAADPRDARLGWRRRTHGVGGGLVPGLSRAGIRGDRGR